MSPKNYLLLLGAGFSRNWGGWLAAEAFEYLIGCPELDQHSINLLWDHKRKGGFESALAELQGSLGNATSIPSDSSLAKMQNAIIQMFKDLDTAYSAITDFNLATPSSHTLAGFLARFDTIFTLNQDTLLERFYADQNISLVEPYKTGPVLPGVRLIEDQSYSKTGKNTARMSPDNDHLEVSEFTKPIFKLHGSWNWHAPDLEALLVLGAHKTATIQSHKILSWYYDEFKKRLLQANTRLMVIGYSFGDDHINSAIRTGAKEGNLELFVIDPLGVDVIDKNRAAIVYGPDDLAKDVWPSVVGSSRRSLREIFGDDAAEFGKMMRFFN